MDILPRGARFAAHLYCGCTRTTRVRLVYYATTVCLHCLRCAHVASPAALHAAVAGYHHHASRLPAHARHRLPPAAAPPPHTHTGFLPTDAHPTVYHTCYHFTVVLRHVYCTHGRAHCHWFAHARGSRSCVWTGLVRLPPRTGCCLRRSVHVTGCTHSCGHLRSARYLLHILYTLFYRLGQDVLDGYTPRLPVLLRTPHTFDWLLPTAIVTCWFAFIWLHYPTDRLRYTHTVVLLHTFVPHTPPFCITHFRFYFTVALHTTRFTSYDTRLLHDFTPPLRTHVIPHTHVLHFIYFTPHMQLPLHWLPGSAFFVYTVLPFPAFWVLRTIPPLPFYDCSDFVQEAFVYLPRSPTHIPFTHTTVTVIPHCSHSLTLGDLQPALPDSYNSPPGRRPYGRLIPYRSG